MLHIYFAMHFHKNIGLCRRHVAKLSISTRLASRMTSTVVELERYNRAVNKLNVLQTSAITNKRLQAYKNDKCLVLMRQLLHRVNITQSNLKNLNIIHVAGTKGKGSTCAFVESILRHHGYKTGLYTSPHLVEVRERIKVNGKPIPKNKFSHYLEEIYSKLESTKNLYEIHLPSYFYFMTVMAFHVFMQERVDVAIIEVGIGGSFDCTNVIDSPLVCGITSLGMDHVNLLGNSLASIAKHKSGIFKEGVPGFFTPQSKEAVEVILNRAKDVKATVHLTPNFSLYKNSQTIQLGLAGAHQYKNASLALQLSQYFINFKTGQRSANLSQKIAMPFPLSQKYIDGLQCCVWKGRAQIVKFDKITFYLDAAHTNESMECCANWFEEEADREMDQLDQPCTRVLAFNITKQRNAKSMFQQLMNCDLTHAIFVPNIATLRETSSADQVNFVNPVEQQLYTVVENHKIWLALKQEQLLISDVVQQQRYATSIGYDITTDFENLHYNDIISKTTVFSSIANSVRWLADNRDFKLSGMASELCTEQVTSFTPDINPNHHLQVLVTGSVHLVGGFLRIIDPSLND